MEISRQAWAEPRRQHALPSNELLKLKAAQLRASLRPASTEMIAAELSRCLSLCAASAMTMEDRAEWIAVASLEFTDMPEDIFLAACASARRTCDHPSKLVPAIMRFEPETSAETRRYILRQTLMQIENAGRLVLPTEPEPEEEMTEAERAEVARLMADLSRELQMKADAQGGAA